MSESNVSSAHPAPLNREEMMSALFANLVIQQTNMAMMLLGQIPNPESGETMQDLAAARMFIDQLEMLEVKTKGNLNKQEEQLLKQSLTSLRLSFVEAASSPQTGGSTRPEPASHDGESATQGTQPAPAESKPAESSEEAHRPKFSKKY